MPPPFEHSLRRAPAPPNVRVHDVHRAARMLGEDLERRAADVGAGRGASVRIELAVDDLEAAAADEDRPTAILGLGAGRAAVAERDVLHRERGVVLVLAVRRRPHQVRVAGVHVQDPPRALTVQGDEPAAIEDDVRPVVEYAGRGAHGDGHRVRAAVEGDDAAQGDRIDHRRRRAARGGAGPDHTIGVGRVDRTGGSWNRRLSRRIAGDRRRRIDPREAEGALEERGHLAARHDAARAEPGAAAAGGDARAPQRVDVGLVGAALVIGEVVGRGRRQVEAAHEERGHLGARDKPIRAEATRRAARRHAGRTEAVDARLVGVVLVIGEVVGGGRRQVERPHQEGRHLPPRHEARRAEDLRAAAARDALGRDRLDRRLVVEAVVVEERPARLQAAAGRRRRGERHADEEGQQQSEGSLAATIHGQSADPSPSWLRHTSGSFVPH